MSEIDSFITKFSGLSEEYTFYGGEVTLRYDPKDHVYLLVTPTGLERQDGVTTICHIVDKSNVLIPWACKMMEQKFLHLSEPFYERLDAGEGNVAEYYSYSVDKLLDVLKQAKSAHRDKLEDAGEVGHKAHAWIEEQIKSLIAHKDDDTIYPVIFPKEDERVTHCSIAAVSWMTNHNVRWISTERKIYSRTHKYAGTMDGLCLADSCSDPKCCKQPFKDRLTLADWKTSNYLYVEYILQTAAYKQAYEEETGEHIEDIWVIRLGKTDAEFDAWHVDAETAELGWQAFQAALSLSRAMVLVEDAVGQMKDYRKGLLKAEKAAQRAENLKVKCKGADRYKGVRPPKCNDGNPCETCLKTYNDAQAAKTQRFKDLAAVDDKIALGTGKIPSQEAVSELQKLLDKWG